LVVLQQPGDRIGLILALGDRRVARPGVLHQLDWMRLLGDLEPRVRVFLAALDLVDRELAVGDRIEALHLHRHLAIGDGLDFERMKATKLADLVEGERGVLDQPDGRGFGHKRQRHYSSSIARCFEGESFMPEIGVYSLLPVIWEGARGL
jgi:hypothetical protein